MLPPLDTLPEKPPVHTLGWGVLDWSLTRFVQVDGDNPGDPWRPTLRQALFLLHAYAIDEDGRFVHRELVRRLAKGSGKSPFAAFLGLAELCGPVRFDYWGHDDQPVARPESMPLVQLAATAESQNENTASFIRAWSAKGSRLQREYGLDPGKMITYYPSANGELRIITSSSAAAEGARPTFVIADETEVWFSTNGGPKLYRTLSANAAKRGGRILQTTNAWVPGTASVAEATWDAYLAQQEGRVRSRSTMLYDAVEAPDDVVLTDPDSLREALRIVYADCPWVDVERFMDEVWAPTMTASEARRKYLNQRVAEADAWVTPTEWGALVDAERVVADQEELVLFFDGSLSSDATALIGCAMSDGHVFTLGVWEPDPNDPDSIVPTAEVDATVRRAFENYSVLAFFADVREWESFVRLSWPDEFGDRLLVPAKASTNGKNPEPIAWDMRGGGGSHQMLFAEATELCEAEIRDKTFTHDGNSVVARHIGNARRRSKFGKTFIYKAEPTKKIDAAVCVIGARMVRRQVLNSKQYAKRNRRGSGMVVFK